MEGLEIWVTSLIRYDKFGNGQVIKSFTKISKDSEVKGMNKTKKKKKTKPEPKPEPKKEKIKSTKKGDIELW